MKEQHEPRTMHLFAGVGGGLLADLILGHTPIVAVEWDAYACQVLRERAADGWFPKLRVWEGDVRLFDPTPYASGVDRIDVIHAGFPCQDLSRAGNQLGLGAGTRSGLYREVLRIAGVIRPRYIFLENVAAITNNGLGTVIADLAEMGMDSRWLCIRASDVGACHHRDRWFLLAHPEWDKQPRTEPCERETRRMGGEFKPLAWQRDWESALRCFRGVDVRTAFQVDRTDGIRNAQVPLQAAVAYKLLGG